MVKKGIDKGIFKVARCRVDNHPRRLAYGDNFFVLEQDLPARTYATVVQIILYSENPEKNGMVARKWTQGS